MKREGRIACKLFLPNSTCAAGLLLHYKSMITARWNLYSYWHKESSAKNITDDEFLSIAEFASVLYPIGKLIWYVQSDQHDG